MGKYAPLREHLLNRQQKVWHAHFTEIEKIIGQSLPKAQGIITLGGQTKSTVRNALLG